MVQPNEQNTLGFGINDMPLWLFKEFKEECRLYHNNTHWVTLMSWHDKAKAYDAIMSGQATVAVPVQEQQEVKVEEDEEPQGVMTIGGFQRG